MKKFFIIDIRHPWKKVFETDGEAIGKKRAMVKFFYTPKNSSTSKCYTRVIGVSAFPSLLAAERARIGAIVKIHGNGYLKRKQHDIWSMNEYAFERLK